MKPTCQRCLRAGRRCLTSSIIEQTGFTINNENSYASGKLKRPRGPRSSLTILRPQADLEERALDYFFLHHVVQVDDLSSDIPDVAKGLCICTALWKASGRKSTMVDTALACVSIAVFAYTQQCHDIAVDASIRYGRLLRMMQKKVHNFPVLPTISSSDDEETIDAYLLTMLLLGRYESTMHNHSSIPPSYESTASLQRWIHHDGALIVLERWSEQNFGLCASPPTAIMKLARRGMIQSSLRQNSALQEWILDGSRFGERGLGLEYDRILINTIDLYQRVNGLSQQDFWTDSALELIKIAQELDLALGAWASTFPDAWAFRRQVVARPISCSQADYYPTTRFDCDKPGYVAVWIQYFATGMLISSTCLDVFNRLAEGQSLPESNCVEEQRQKCLEQLGSMSDSMASAAVAFSLFEKSRSLKGNGSRSPPLVSSKEKVVLPALEQTPSTVGLIVWPLALAASVHGVKPQQQKWFRMELARIGKLLGNGFLELAATSPEWTVLNNCGVDNGSRRGHY